MISARTQRRGLAAVAFAVLWSFGSPGAVAISRPPPSVPPPPPFLQTALALDLTVDYDRPSIDGTATLTLENAGSAATDTIPLLLNRLMRIRDVRDAEGRRLPTSSSVEVFDDDPFKQVRRATVTLPAALAPGRRAAITVSYGGPLVGYAETGSLYIKDRIDPAFTIIRSDALAFPGVGVPSDAANRAMTRRDFDFDARIVVPGTQVVAAGGTEVERKVVGSRVAYRFAGRRVPFLNIAVAPFSVEERNGIRVYALPDDRARAGAVADAGRQAMALLEKWFGSLPSAPRVTVIEIPEGFGSQASATAGIILDAAAFKDPAQLPQFYHELTHFWNAADLDAPSPRWNEGLAMFLQYRLASEIDGFTRTSDVLERARRRVCDPAARTELERVPFARFGLEGKTDFSYRVGLLLFSGLERLVGRQALDARLRAYLQAHLVSGGRARQFLDALSTGGSDPVAGPFLRDWFETSRWLGPTCSAATFEDAVATWRRNRP